MSEDNQDQPIHDPTITDHVSQTLNIDRAKLPPLVGLSIDQTLRDDQARRLTTDDEVIAAKFLGDPDWYEKNEKGRNLAPSAQAAPQGDIKVTIPPGPIKK